MYYASCQNCFNLVCRTFESELAEVCAPANLDLALMPWSAMAGGWLDGRMGGGAMAVLVWVGPWAGYWATLAVRVQASLVGARLRFAHAALVFLSFLYFNYLLRYEWSLVNHVVPCWDAGGSLSGKYLNGKMPPKSRFDLFGKR